MTVSSPLSAHLLEVAMTQWSFPTPSRRYVSYVCGMQDIPAEANELSVGLDPVATTV
jgi:hypothetical protein